MRRGDILELEISGVAFGGKGIAKVDGMAVFVDQAVAGDRVQARIVKKKKSYAEARVLEIVAPSADRIEAPCPYSGHCGGCKWQFLDYERQLEYKRRHVCESLEHLAGLKEIPVAATLGSEKVFGYRNKMEFTCSDHRWVLPGEMDREDIDRSFALGLHVPGTFNKVLDTDACLLQPDLGNRLLNEVRHYIRGSGLAVYNLKSHRGFWRFVMLRHSVSQDQWMVNIVTASEDREAVAPLATALTAGYPQVASVVNNITARKAGVAVGEFEVQLAGAAVLTETIGDLVFDISANSFFQTNTRGAHELYALVAEFAELTGREAVTDLYCGTGTIALYLAHSARSVVGIEIAESAVADARRNSRKNRIDNCRFIQGDIRQCLAQIKQRSEVMIIDPPRAGMHKDVVQQVLAAAPDQIVYVSCNPPTMARDVALMSQRYALVAVQPVDMFPHTPHIETVAKLVRL